MNARLSRLHLMLRYIKTEQNCKHLLFTQRKVAESADLSSQLEQVRRDFAIAMNELQRLQMLLKNASQAIRTALQVHCNNYCCIRTHHVCIAQPRCHGIQADSSPVRRGLLNTLLTLMDNGDDQSSIIR